MTAPTYGPADDLRIGLILPNKGHGSDGEILDAAASSAADLGWHSVWVTDHLMVPRGPEEDEYGWMLEALTALTWVAARHESLTVGTSVVVPAIRDAPLLAKQLATLDVLTGGRLVVGVGVSDAGDLVEYQNMGKEDRFKLRGRYVDEAIALWRHLWSGSTEPFHGEFHQLEDFVFRPTPVRGADVPIWCGGRSERALRRTAQLADGYHAAQTGPQDVADRLPRLAELASDAGRSLPTVSVRARVFFDDQERAVYTIHGSADDMIDQLHGFAQVGTEELIVVFDAKSPKDLERQCHRFDEDVVGPFRARVASAAPAGRG